MSEVLGSLGDDAEVLGHGDDRPPRRYGGFLAGAAALALLAVGVAGALRSPEDEPSPRASATPSPSFTSGWTEYPPDGDPFETYVIAHRPAPGGAEAMLLSGGVPLVLADEGGTIVAYEAVGGPPHAPVMLGLCPEDGALLAPDLSFGYLRGVPTGALTAPLRTYPVRETAQEGHVEIGLRAQGGFIEIGATAGFEAACGPDELVYAPVPGRAESLAAAGRAFALMDGRYVVTTETRAFCPASADGRCQSAGWEEYGPLSVLPPGDLVGAYTWQGEFLVRANPRDGSLTVVRTRATRLVSRERVGVKARVGWAESSYERGGVVHLRFNAFRSGEHPDDSPRGVPPVQVPEPGLVDESGGLRDYALAPDAEVHLGRGFTGIGRPAGTPALLRDYLRAAAPYTESPLWLVFDARGRVIRVVLG